LRFFAHIAGKLFEGQANLGPLVKAVAQDAAWKALWRFTARRKPPDEFSRQSAFTDASGTPEGYHPTRL
jgi:hypothetical protein